MDLKELVDSGKFSNLEVQIMTLFGDTGIVQAELF